MFGLDQEPSFQRIDPAILRIPHGHHTDEFFNKFNGVDEGLHAGLPVPALLGPQEIAEAQARVAGNYPHPVSKEEVDAHWETKTMGYTRRGYFTYTPIDSFAADTTVSSPIFCPEDEEMYRQDVFWRSNNPMLQRYLRTNFGVEDIPGIDSFAQERVGEREFFSVLSRGSERFVMLQYADEMSGVMWLWFKNGKFISGCEYADGITDMVEENVFPITSRADYVYDGLLEKKLDWKYDVVGTHDWRHLLLQARPVGLKMTEDEIAAQQAYIDKWVRDGMQVVETEIGELPAAVSRFIRANPDQYFVLKIRNTAHLRLRSFDAYGLDLTHMAAVQYPEGMASGLQGHGGIVPYLIAAYNGKSIGFYKADDR